MARAMRAAVEAGWAARHAGRIPQRLHAEASTPEAGHARARLSACARRRWPAP